MGNNKPSQSKRRKLRARREKLAQSLALQRSERSSAEPQANLLKNYLKVPVEYRQDLFKHTFCKDCLFNNPKPNCIKCFSKNNKIKKINTPAPSCDTFSQYASKSTLTLKKKLKDISNTSCYRHRGGIPVKIPCISCLEIQQDLINKFSRKFNQENNPA